MKKRRIVILIIAILLLIVLGIFALRKTKTLSVLLIRIFERVLHDI